MNTCHIHRDRDVLPGGLDPCSQLTIVAIAPALDPATALDDAFVIITHTNGDGRDTCLGGWVLGGAN